MRYNDFKTLLEYDRSKTTASLGAAIEKRAATDAYLKSQTADPVSAVIAKAEEADPTANKQYVVWVVRQYIKNNLKYEDIYKLEDNLAVFAKTKGQHKRLGINSDINQYDWKTLADVAKKLGSTDIADTDQADPTQVKDAKVLYNGPLGMLSVPETEAASCELGRGTKWCTASQKNNMFAYYNKQGPLYVWHDKKHKDKYQFHFESGQFMDDRDEPIDSDVMHYLTQKNPVTSKLFMKKAPAVIQLYVDYLKGRYDDDGDEYRDGGEEILDTDIVAMISSIPFEDAVKLIMPALKYSREESDSYQFLDALIKRFDRNSTELETALKINDRQGFYKFSDAYRKYKLLRAPKEETIKYILDHQDDQYSASYALDLAKRSKTAIPELEPIIAKDPRNAYQYAYSALNQSRFPEAESVIAKDSWAATYYAINILKKRWPEAEETIKQVKPHWDTYIKKLG